MSKIFIEESSLTAIGDAIREKTGLSDKMSPAQMVTAIGNITGGGGGDIDIEPIVLTGGLGYACSGVMTSKFIEMYGDKVSTENVEACEYTFYKNTLKRIPFSMNFKQGDTSARSLSSMFAYTDNLEYLPEMNYPYPNNLTNFCTTAKSLKEIPDGFASTWNWDKMHTYSYASANAMFNSCYSLTYIAPDFLKEMWCASATSSSYNSAFRNCYNLNEVRNLGITTINAASNMFKDIAYYCYCLRAFTFAVNEDGTPKTANWKKQTLDLSTYVGYRQLQYNWYTRDGEAWNSGRTIDDCIYDDATYQKNKDNPMRFVCGFTEENPVDYALYNHDSAVETINSLPDCSAYCGTDMNTIKFKGAAGAKTDGGAINTLTEDEIAIATAKGWKVQFV